ncbi:RluA family pseudouridine synthase [Metamycoplasma hyosynoviae]|uniref:RluA family pseudouridine synthase n=1 Tax=Metamycoplasma hyosynoviae TaxID=29559 RepID=UPI002358E5A9|nr:RluA family pseudouridine synthase [Metamycoplasma hyosynoviae]MDC8911562.1 RluA family pseudouridine synthase [Metamycoplasma hyosynoviae]MDC8914328.1 RluA family pseudouridine synthase [Metamycoplasma hyosynoviae]MDC8919301.1 RluA family pseudouridine synthase [Metamycoplasma hyosynoviae]MDC8919753.1 RluA family pseudouridine synthase [Metamycoplasma hyosynoviae]MDC8937740.1 RluA family pseudouridine synthase [Metamycoplasma hyosynoviae]
MNKTFKAKNNDINRSLFKYLVRMLDNVPISRIEKLFREKDIKINGKRTNDKQYKLQLDDEIIVYGLSDIQKELQHNSSQINFSVIYEDKNLLIVDKHYDIAMHSEENCLNDQVLKYLNYKKTSSFIPSSIGRIDKKTSGLVVYAKNYKTLVEFEEKQNHFEKIYQFVSDFQEPYKEVTVRLKKDIKNEKMVVDENFGIKAKTIFKIEGNRKYAQILTGKKHQIRATLEYLKAPILGDLKYGGKRARRMFLHSYSITFKNLGEDFEEYNNQTFICHPHW